MICKIFILLTSVLPIGQPEAIVADAFSGCWGGDNTILHMVVVVPPSNVRGCRHRVAPVKVDSDSERSVESTGGGQGSSSIPCYRVPQESADLVDNVGNNKTISCTSNTILETLNQQIVTRSFRIGISGVMGCNPCA